MTADVGAPLSTGPAKSVAGTLLTAIAGLHIAFVLVLGSGLIADPQMRELVGDQAPLLMMRPGFGSDQPANLLLLTLFWSLFFGFTLAILGVFIREVERRGDAVPRVVGALCCACVLSAPCSFQCPGFGSASFPRF